METVLTSFVFLAVTKFPNHAVSSQPFETEGRPRRLKEKPFPSFLQSPRNPKFVHDFMFSEGLLRSFVIPKSEQRQEHVRGSLGNNGCVFCSERVLTHVPSEIPFSRPGES